MKTLQTLFLFLAATRNVNAVEANWVHDTLETIFNGASAVSSSLQVATSKKWLENSLNDLSNGATAVMDSLSMKDGGDEEVSHSGTTSIPEVPAAQILGQPTGLGNTEKFLSESNGPYFLKGSVSQE